MHPTEGMWQEFLDGESEAQVHLVLATHQQDCSDCQRIVAALDGGRAQAAELLDRIGASVPVRSLADVLSRPRSRTSRQSFLVAAIVALCVVTAAGATVRSGLIQRVMHRLVGAAPKAEPPADPTLPSAPAAASSTGVVFVPAGVVEIGFEQWPRRGEIEIALRDVSEVSVTASVPSAYTVRAGRVVVANRGLAASYRIILPHSVSVASIRVGDRVVFSKRGAALNTQARKTGPDSYVLSFNTGARVP
jgi:hypothetical protein